jgi:hypothetical protein
LISATVFFLLSVVLVISGGTMAAGVTGVYTSTVPDEGYFDHTYPADYTYDARLTLNAGGSGSLWLECTDVVVNAAGWEAAYDMLGRSQTVDVDWISLGSTVTITINDNYGGHYPLQVTLSGDRLSGSGSYTDISYVTNSWQMDVTKGGGGSSVSLGLTGMAGLAGAVAIGGFLVGFAVSLLPPPRKMGGSIMPQNNSPLGTPYAPSQSVVLNHQLSSMGNQQYPGGVTRPLPDVPRMRMFEPMQFPNVQMGQTTVVQPTDIHQTDVLSKRSCPNCGSTLMVTAAGWSCPFCNRAPPGGLDPQ